MAGKANAVTLPDVTDLRTLRGALELAVERMARDLAYRDHLDNWRSVTDRGNAYDRMTAAAQAYGVLAAAIDPDGRPLIWADGYCEPQHHLGGRVDGADGYYIEATWAERLIEDKLAGARAAYWTKPGA